MTSGLYFPINHNGVDRWHYSANSNGPGPDWMVRFKTDSKLSRADLNIMDIVSSKGNVLDGPFWTFNMYIKYTLSLVHNIMYMYISILHI